MKTYNIYEQSEWSVESDKKELKLSDIFNVFKIDNDIQDYLSMGDKYPSEDTRIKLDSMIREIWKKRKGWVSISETEFKISNLTELESIVKPSAIKLVEYIANSSHKEKWSLKMARNLIERWKDLENIDLGTIESYYILPVFNISSSSNIKALIDAKITPSQAKNAIVIYMNNKKVQWEYESNWKLWEFCIKLKNSWYNFKWDKTFDPYKELSWFNSTESKKETPLIDITTLSKDFDSWLKMVDSGNTMNEFWWSSKIVWVESDFEVYLENNKSYDAIAIQLANKILQFKLGNLKKHPDINALEDLLNFEKILTHHAIIYEKVDVKWSLNKIIKSVKNMQKSYLESNMLEFSHILSQWDLLVEYWLIDKFIDAIVDRINKLWWFNFWWKDRSLALEKKITYSDLFNEIQLISSLLKANPNNQKIKTYVEKVMEKINWEMEWAYGWVVEKFNQINLWQAKILFDYIYVLKANSTPPFSEKIDELYTKYSELFKWLNTQYTTSTLSTLHEVSFQWTKWKTIWLVYDYFMGKVKDTNNFNGALSNKELSEYWLTLNYEVVLENNSEDWKYLLNDNSVVPTEHREIIMQWDSESNWDVILVNQENEWLIIRMSGHHFIAALSNQEFWTEISRVKQRNKEEIAWIWTLENFDLPKEAFWYINLTDSYIDKERTYNDVVSWGIPHSIQFENKLQSKYPKMVDLWTHISATPKNLLEESIMQWKQRWLDYFFIDINAHGFENWLAFWEDGSLTANDFVELQKKHTVHFCITSPACFGWWLMKWFQEEFLKDPSLQSNINIFMQTQSDFVNHSYMHEIYKKDENGDMYTEKVPLSTLYSMYLYEGLDKFDTYWKAVKYASDKVKQIAFLDAEWIINWTIVDNWEYTNQKTVW